MSLCPDDEAITDEQRLDDIASILAQGVLRLRSRQLLPTDIAPESAESGLALCSTSCPHPVTGLTPRK